MICSGGIVVEGQQHVEVVGDLRGRLGELRAVQVGEALRRGVGVALVFGTPDFGQGSFRALVGGLG
jgi:hypothetical protein